MRNFWKRLVASWTNFWVAEDPYPEYSRLDRLDGLRHHHEEHPDDRD